jgi:hypothetical protein
MLDLTRSRLRPALTISLISIIIPTYAAAHLRSDPRAAVESAPGASTRPAAAVDVASSPGGLDRELPPRAFWLRLDARWDRVMTRRAAARARLQRIQEVALASARSRFGLHGVPDWAAIAYCESDGRWDTNSSNGFWGGLQFTPQTWFVSGGGPFDGVGPFPYTRAEQIAVAWQVYATQGPFAWPSSFHWR